MDRKSFSRLAWATARSGASVHWWLDPAVSCGATIVVAVLQGSFTAATAWDAAELLDVLITTFASMQLVRIVWRRYRIVPFDMYEGLQTTVRRQATGAELQAIADTLQERRRWCVHNILNGTFPAAADGQEALMAWNGEVFVMLEKAGVSEATKDHFNDLVSYATTVPNEPFRGMALEKINRLDHIISDFERRAELASGAYVLPSGAS